MEKRAERTGQKNFVAIALAEDVELARDYVQMLRDNDIAARFQANDQIVEGGGVTILVSEESFERAQSLIRARSSGADFSDSIYEGDWAGKTEDTED